MGDATGPSVLGLSNHLPVLVASVLASTCAFWGVGIGGRERDFQQGLLFAGKVFWNLNSADPPHAGVELAARFIGAYTPSGGGTPL